MPGAAVVHDAVADPDRARARPLQPGDRAQRGGLAAAGGAQQRQLLARLGARS